jgi:hypothetical protein
MIIYLLAFILFQTVDTTDLQDPILINESLIAENTTYFTINNYKFEGADSLLFALENAHFVALGELHNRERLGELTDAILTYLQPLGFDNFAVETGPYSAKKLQDLVTEGYKEVSDFYNTYSSKLFNIYPIPFFLGEPDIKMLSRANSFGYELWGLDQEFAYSYTYLIDELAELAGESITNEQQKLQRKLKSKLYWMNRRNRIFSGFDRSCRLKEDDRMQGYLQSFEKSEQPEIQQILNAFNTTFEIYCLAEQGKASSQVRINYFKENFNRNYIAAKEQKPEPKVLIKIGSFHAGRQRSPIGLYDIGNHVNVLADSLSQQSVHIRYLNRYYKGDDMLGKKGWEDSSNFIRVGLRDRWALIDLRPLRNMLIDGSLEVNNYEKREIINYDFIVIPPEDDIVEKHY